MPDFIDAIQSQVLDNYCALTAPANAFVELASPVINTLPSTGPVDAVTGAVQQLRGYRNAICSAPFDDATSAVPIPFAGGQCVGDIYQVLTSRNGGTPNLQTMTDEGELIQGPITGIEEFDNGSGLLNYRLVVGNGFTTLATNFTTPQNFTIVGITNVTDPSDPCGNPPRDIPQYNENNFTFSPTINYDDPSTGLPLTINPTGVFAPVFVDVDGSVNAPVRLTISPDVFVDLNLDLSTGETTIRNNNNFDVSVNDEPFEVPELPDELPEDLTVIGVRVVSVVPSQIARGREISQLGGSLTLYVPRIGSVYFIYADSSGQTVFGRDNDVKLSDQIIYADRACVGAQVSPIEGVTSTISFIVVRGKPVESYW